MEMTDWQIYRKDAEPHEGIRELPPPPKWRTFLDESECPAGDNLPGSHESANRGSDYKADDDQIDLVNAALYLRRPLLVTGRPGSGKSSLAYSIAWQLKLGPVLRWSITSRSSLQESLYRYDAIGRLHEAGVSGESATDIGRYVRLGPLGTALYTRRYPRVLLVDEIDKSDIDLPNDLLNVFEEGEFDIPELARLKNVEDVSVLTYDSDHMERVPVHGGRVRCCAFPIVVMTSNGEREFPAAFLRRCIRLDLRDPDEAKLESIVRAHLGDSAVTSGASLTSTFVESLHRGDVVATDQLLNAIYLLSGSAEIPEEKKRFLTEMLLRPLESTEYE
jgi:MoxR-like ATPase